MASGTGRRAARLAASAFASLASPSRRSKAARVEPENRAAMLVNSASKAWRFSDATRRSRAAGRKNNACRQ
jgi:hypothetical protein